MSFLKKLLDIREIKTPIFFKEFTENNKNLVELESIFNLVYSEKKKIINEDIIRVKIGIQGEKNVAYELKNSYIPMICLHDIRIEHEGNIAQLDFVLVTEKFIMVLETKKLNGDIDINEVGEFTRKFKNANGKVYKEEGIYSPIAQNDRHIRILEDYLKKHKIIRRVPIYSAVVIASSRSIINREKAPATIKNIIFKYDQLTHMINKKLESIDKDSKMFESRMIEIAKFLVDNNVEIKYDYYKRYHLKEEDFVKDKNKSELEFLDINNMKTKELRSPNIISDDELYSKLKAYRLERAREKNVRAYCIFTNNTLDELILEKPRSEDELAKIKGLGKIKVEEFGKEIIEIIKLS
ncbi:NERD domain-containing protein [uncultured Clostridium sp.]|jgi:hypothetical protein|uniref:NERD domain-containing protein n=1 Tax=uncultured Clostridium sp. TaxID=59620 RepID=UPI0026190421|nr:NERD domain-containing protein [uncultured Clostridium sp.]